MYTSTLPIWPLPATLAPHAHVSWDEFVADAIAHVSCQHPGVLLPRARPAGQARPYPAPAMNAPLPWPLPATQVIGARLTWDAFRAHLAQPHQPPIVQLALSEVPPAARMERELVTTTG